MSTTIENDQIIEESNCSETEPREEKNNEEEEEDLKKLLLPDPQNLPLTPPSAVETNFVTYFALDFTKPGHDQYIYRHANGLCVIGLAPSHIAFKDEGGITAIDFNVGKSDRSGVKVTGKRKKNAQHFESNTALCKVSTKNDSYIVRCCVKGSLLEVNPQLITHPELLNVSEIGVEVKTVMRFFLRILEGAVQPQKIDDEKMHQFFPSSLDVCLRMLMTSSIYPSTYEGKEPIYSLTLADREGYIAIMMPKPADWLKVKASFVSLQEYKKMREVSCNIKNAVPCDDDTLKETS
ncbi:protein FAM206A-like protein [Trifolium pratense]|uniref:Protein FAM206A-like protein n=1 Tax=Trifolium pratense TaxID=57577 RepID=A0A2K3NPC1_TRIPR|nr:protein FAM206A-like protein [Trifolium pratense]